MLFMDFGCIEKRKAKPSSYSVFIFIFIRICLGKI